jgi:hypothetical protein
MPHMRSRIREKVRAVLVAASTAAGSRVYKAKRRSWVSKELPGIAVYTDAETSETSAKDRLQTRTVDLVLDVAAYETDDIEDELDEMVSEVEVAMAADLTLAGLAWDLRLVSTDSDASTDGERPVGVRRIRFSVIYQTAEGAPSAVG